jgi:hypothetical protein
MIIGIYFGYSAEDWRFAAEQFVKRIPDKLIVHRAFFILISSSGHLSFLILNVCLLYLNFETIVDICNVDIFFLR